MRTKKKKEILIEEEGGGLVFAEGIFGLCVGDSIQFDTEKLVSYSQYAKFKKCPKSWELRYVRKHRVPEQNIYFVYGTAMHETIQEMLYVCYKKAVKKAKETDWNAIFLNKLKTLYTKDIDELGGVHYSSKEELAEFYHDGCQILKYILKKRTTYFSSKHTTLVGIEIPIFIAPDPSRPTIKLQSHLDLVFYNKVSGKYRIIDIKTARNGWNKYKRKDKTVTNQLVLYKKYFCEKFGIDPEKVDIEYFIVRQKIDEDSLWPIPRVSQFKPASGKVSIKRVEKDFQYFIDSCFDKSGEYLDISHQALQGKRENWNCKFCNYNDRHDLCPPDERVIGEL